VPPVLHRPARFAVSTFLELGLPVPDLFTDRLDVDMTIIISFREAPVGLAATSMAVWPWRLMADNSECGS
jgi:hypothetical protein